MSNFAICPVPTSRCLMFSGEVAENYLTCSRDQKLTTSLKIVSYIVSAGILPIVAYLVMRKYHRMQNNARIELQNFASQSIDNAFWVTQNVQRFRIKVPHFRYSIAKEIQESFRKNWLSFEEYQKQFDTKLYNGNHWLHNFNLDQNQLSIILNHISLELDHAVRNNSYSKVLNDLNLLPLNDDERLGLFQSLAWEGIVPSPQIATKVEERMGIMRSLARANRKDKDFFLNALAEYRLSPDQRFEIVSLFVERDMSILDSPQEIDSLGLTDEQKQKLGTLAIATIISRKADQTIWKSQEIMNVINIMAPRISNLKVSKNLLSSPIQELIKLARLKESDLKEINNLVTNKECDVKEKAS